MPRLKKLTAEQLHRASWFGSISNLLTPWYDPDSFQRWWFAPSEQLNGKSPDTIISAGPEGPARDLEVLWTHVQHLAHEGVAARRRDLQLQN